MLGDDFRRAWQPQCWTVASSVFAAQRENAGHDGSASGARSAPQARGGWQANSLRRYPPSKGGGVTKMPMTRGTKEKLQAEIAERLSRAKAALVADYAGLNVAAVTEIRKVFRAAGVEYKVVKNT